MRLRCTCGHDGDVELNDGADELGCPDCGRRYRVFVHGAKVDLVEIEDLNLDSAFLDLERGPEEPLPQEAPSDETPTEEIEVLLPVRPEPRRWWPYVLTAPFYPLRGNAKWVLLVWLTAHLIVSGGFGRLFWLSIGVPGAGSSLGAFGLFLLGLAALAFNLAMLGAMARYVFHLIHRSAWEPDTPSSLPQFDNVYDFLGWPLLLVLAILGASGWPLWLAVCIWKIVPGMPAWWPVVIAVCGLVFLFVLPMNALAVATADDARALSPRATFPAIARLAGPYLLLCLFCAPAGALTCLAPFSFLGWVGWGVLITPLAEVVWVYLLVASARVLGAFYYGYSEQLGWIRELTSEPLPPPRSFGR